MDSLLQYSFYFILGAACCLTFYIGLQLARVAVKALLIRLFPKKELKVIVHDENGNVQTKVIQSSDYMALVETILVEAKRNTSKKKKHPKLSNAAG
jgi:hypothetical protein